MISIRPPPSPAPTSSEATWNGLETFIVFVTPSGGIRMVTCDASAFGILPSVQYCGSKKSIAADVFVGPSRAALEAIAYQSKDVLDTMIADVGEPPKELEVDGGACANNFLMQFQADITGITVARPKLLEATAAGAAMLAGHYVGFYPDLSAIAASRVIERRFEPKMPREEAEKLLAGWNRAVWRALDWEKPADEE